MSCLSDFSRRAGGAHSVPLGGDNRLPHCFRHAPVFSAERRRALGAGPQPVNHPPTTFLLFYHASHATEPAQNSRLDASPGCFAPGELWLSPKRLVEPSLEVPQRFHRENEPFGQRNRRLGGIAGVFQHDDKRQTRTLHRHVARKPRMVAPVSPRLSSPGLAGEG